MSRTCSRCGRKLRGDDYIFSSHTRSYYCGVRADESCARRAAKARALERQRAVEAEVDAA